MRTPFPSSFGCLEFRTFLPALLGVCAFAWIAGCGSSDPDPSIQTMTWGTTSSTTTDAAVPLDGSSGIDTTNGSPGSDAAIDAANEPVQSFRNPDAGPEVCSAPNVICSDDDAGTSACVAVGTDPGNCGACGNICMGNDATCIGGQCACTGLHEDYCDDACADLSSDTNNCGSCGNVCPMGQDCNGGACDDGDDN